MPPLGEGSMDSLPVPHLSSPVPWTRREARLDSQGRVERAPGVPNALALPHSHLTDWPVGRGRGERGLRVLSAAGQAVTPKVKARALPPSLSYS